MINRFKSDPYMRAAEPAKQFHKLSHPELQIALDMMTQTLEAFDRAEQQQNLDLVKEAANKNAEYLIKLLGDFKKTL